MPQTNTITNQKSIDKLEDGRNTGTRSYTATEATRQAMQEILDESGGFNDDKESLFCWLDADTLELSRIWCWQKFPRSKYTPDTILDLYWFIKASQWDGLSIGPTVFRYCSTLEEIQAQHERTKSILGKDFESFVKGEKVVIATVDDYETCIHRHDCPFGAGLICLSMRREDRDICQISFYPSDPIRIFEIKGSTGTGEPWNTHKRKHDYHRFLGKYHLSPPSALVVECLKIAKIRGLAADVAGFASTWRNYGIARDKNKRGQADKIHGKVKNELRLKYDKQTELLIEAAISLKSIYSEPWTDWDTKNWGKYVRCTELIASLVARNASMFLGGSDEFVTKLLFSAHSDDQLRYGCNSTMVHGRFDPTQDREYLEMLSAAVPAWAERNYRIPRRGSHVDRSEDPNRDWLDFSLPFYIPIGSRERDDLIERYWSLNQKVQ